MLNKKIKKREFHYYIIQRQPIIALWRLYIYINILYIKNMAKKKIFNFY